VTEIVGAETLGSRGALDDGNLVRPHGYSVIEADSLAEAYAIAQQSPLLAFWGSIEVFQLKSFAG